MPIKIKLKDSAYPEALRSLPNPPPTLTTSGPLEVGRAVAIVGSRSASEESMAFAYDLAFQLAKVGIIVVSGGAIGVDGSAHRGAIAAGGATWVVSPTGKDHVYPPQHRDLFAEVAASERSRMIWCFGDQAIQKERSFLYRNGVLVALSEVLVVVQATFASGSRNAANWARSLKKPVWAVTAAPWMTAFGGSLDEIRHKRAQPLCSAEQLFEELGLPTPVRVVDGVDGAVRPKKHGRAPFSRRASAPPPGPVDAGGWSADEKLIFSRLLTHPLHVDQIADRTALPAGSTATALLTLSLKDVVVEGPDGFFRRRSVA